MGIVLSLQMWDVPTGALDLAGDGGETGHKLWLLAWPEGYH
jgi:hypothetical protein